MKCILLPGLDGTGRLFKSLIAELDDFDCVGIDLNLYSDTRYESLAVQISKELGRDPIFLIAESFSGPLALKVASRPNTNVVGICVCASFVSSPVSVNLRYLPWNLLLSVKPPKFVVKQFLTGFLHETVVNEFYQALEQTCSSILSERVHEVLKLKSEDLPELSLPILYLQPLNDRLLNEKSVENFKEKYRQTVVKQFEGPHLLFQVEAKKTASEISRFVEGIGQMVKSEK